MTTTTNSIDNTIGSASTTNSLSILRSASGEWVHCDDQTDEFGIFNRAGTPEGAIAADIGSLCTDTTNADLYIKTTDTVNTGWSPFTLGGITDVVVQTFTANGTYTPTAGMVVCIVECLGGGGGGQSVGASNPRGGCIGGGGGAGEYRRGLYSASTIGASQAITIGAGGGGGANGASTTFGSLITSNGGGGISSPSGNNNFNVSQGASGGSGGSGGNFNVIGQYGLPGVSLQNNVGVFCFGGSGANSPYGTGGIGPQLVSTTAASSNGVNGSGFGSGGSGAASIEGGAAATGGSGTSGIVVVKEYISS
jgi:hypothetical protein